MPTYPSAEALIADARLRQERFGAKTAILVVEGPDDKRLFGDRTLKRQQVIAAGGRKLLLASHEYARENQLKSIAFLADCDYDIPLGIIRPSESLIITEHTDLEADLLHYGGWERLVSELVPAALDDDDRLSQIVANAMSRTVAITDVIGRYRRVARDLAFKAEYEKIRYTKFRKPGTSQVDEDKLIRTLWQNSVDCPIGLSDLAARVQSIPADYDNCNGHDLVSALNHVLREDYGVRNQTPSTLETLLRHGTPKNSFDQWTVVRRLRKWETNNDVCLLAE